MIYLFTTNADKSYNISDRSISKLKSLLARRLVINLYNVTKQQASKDYFREIEVLPKINLASLIKAIKANHCKLYFYEQSHGLQKILKAFIISGAI